MITFYIRHHKRININLKIQNTTLKYFNNSCLNLRESPQMSYMSLTTKVKVAKFSFLNEKSYNKTVIDFNFDRHKVLSTLKSDVHLALAASVNYHFFG